MEITRWIDSFAPAHSALGFPSTSLASQRLRSRELLAANSNLRMIRLRQGYGATGRNEQDGSSFRIFFLEYLVIISSFGFRISDFES
jgi:hypothetical protein